MSKNFKKLLAVAVVLLGIFVATILIKPGIFMDFGMWLTSSKKHRNAADEKPAFTMTAKSLADAFKTDTTASTKYIDKAMLIDGSVTAIDGSHVTLNNVVCNIDSSELPKLSKIAVGQSVKIQGRLTTYNDLMGEIDMDQCMLK